MLDLRSPFQGSVLDNTLCFGGSGRPYDVSFDLTKPLQDGTGYNTGYKMVYSSSIGAYIGRIELLGGGKPSPADWAIVYPQNGTLDDSYQINTMTILPTNDTYELLIPYNDDASGYYDLAKIVYKGDGTCDRWDGDQSTTPVLTESELLWSPPETNYIIHENPDLPKTPIATIGTILDGEAGTSQTIDILFNVKPIGLALGDFTASANVSVGNIVDVGWVNGRYKYTIDVSLTTNGGTETITLLGASGNYTDQFNNPSKIDTVSNIFFIGNYLVNPTFTGTEEWVPYSADTILSIDNGKIKVDSTASAISTARAYSTPLSDAHPCLKSSAKPSTNYKLTADIIFDGITSSQKITIFERDSSNAALASHDLYTEGTAQSITFTSDANADHFDIWILTRAGGIMWVGNMNLEEA